MKTGYRDTPLLFPIDKKPGSSQQQLMVRGKKDLHRTACSHKFVVRLPENLILKQDFCCFGIDKTCFYYGCVSIFQGLFISRSSP